MFYSPRTVAPLGLRGVSYALHHCAVSAIAAAFRRDRRNINRERQSCGHLRPTDTQSLRSPPRLSLLLSRRVAFNSI